MVAKTTSAIVELLEPEAIARLSNAVRDATEAPTPPPSGDYLVEITDVSLYTAKSGSPCCNLALEVADGIRAGCELRHPIWLTTRAASYLKRDMAAMGIRDVQQLSAAELIGRQLIAAVETSATNGITQARVVSLSAPSKVRGAQTPQTNSPTRSNPAQAILRQEATSE